MDFLMRPSMHLLEDLRELSDPPVEFFCIAVHGFPLLSLEKFQHPREIACPLAFQWNPNS
jgi:hypothetical protein